jgi:hypothetical protein
MTIEMQATSVAQRLANYPLLAAITHRRSRRFARGMQMQVGPLAYRSEHPPQPLSADEEAALAYACCGITGAALSELPFASDDPAHGASGNIMAQIVGRTVASPDGIQCVTAFVINDEGTWMLRRPQDFERAQINELIRLGHAQQLSELYERMRVRLADHRVDPPRMLPFTPSFNHWSSNVAGTTCFVLVNELSSLYINVLLTAFNEEFGYFLVDDRNGFQPAGVGRFARSQGGHLHDDPAAGRMLPIGALDAWICEFAAIEQGAMLQNLGLMTQALGLGGFPHFAAHPFGWLQALGFDMADVPGMPGLLYATGLKLGGQSLMAPFCPPHHASMADAVRAFVDTKFAAGSGVFRDGGAGSAWRDGAAIQAGIPAPSERNVEAAMAACEYIQQTYGRFPGATGPFRTVLMYQAHHLDTAFYDRYYRDEALSDTQRSHPHV